MNTAFTTAGAADLTLLDSDSVLVVDSIGWFVSLQIRFVSSAAASRLERRKVTLDPRNVSRSPTFCPLYALC